jgi:hypothetical protein
LTASWLPSPRWNHRIASARRHRIERATAVVLPAERRAGRKREWEMTRFAVNWSSTSNSRPVPTWRRDSARGGRAAGAPAVRRHRTGE